MGKRLIKGERVRVRFFYIFLKVYLARVVRGRLAVTFLKQSSADLWVLGCVSNWPSSHEKRETQR